jgi:hypothetical protein
MQHRAVSASSREPLLALNSPIPFAAILLLLLVSIALTFAVAIVIAPSLSSLAPLVLGALVALAVRPQSRLMPGDQQALWRWAAVVVPVDLLLVIASPHAEYPGALINQWPTAILVGAAIAAIRTLDAKFALAFYVALGLIAGQFLLGMTIWPAILP